LLILTTVILSEAKNLGLGRAIEILHFVALLSE